MLLYFHKIIVVFIFDPSKTNKPFVLSYNLKKEQIEKFNATECEEQLVYLRYLFQRTQDAELLVRYKLLKSRLEIRLKSFVSQKKAPFRNR
jgi:hypothetical protein